MKIRSVIYDKEYDDVFLVEDFNNIRTSLGINVIAIKTNLYLPKGYKFIEPYLIFAKKERHGEFSPTSQEQHKDVFLDFKIIYV